MTVSREDRLREGGWGGTCTLVGAHEHDMCLWHLYKWVVVITKTNSPTHYLSKGY